MEDNTVVLLRQRRKKNRELSIFPSSSSISASPIMVRFIANFVVLCVIVASVVSGFTKPVPSAFVQGRSSSTPTRLYNTNMKPPIEIVQQADAAFLEQKGVFRWGTWGCDVGSFPWSYGDNESCYLLAGKVTVTPTDGRPAVTFGKGDFVTFPAGMSCQWDVKEPVQKHFTFF